MRHRLRVLVAVAASLFAAHGSLAGPYVFTRIADTSGPYQSFFTPSLNDAGQVAFRARLGGGQQGIFVGNGGLVTTIADTSGAFDTLRDPSINATGQVGFRAFLDGGGEGLFIGSGGPTTPLYDNSGTFFSFRDPILNASGTGAFHGRVNPRGGGIFTGNGGPETAVARTTGPYEDFGNPHLNESGQVVFFARRDNGVVGIYTGPDPVANRIADESGPFLGFGDGPTINDAGLVAFRACISPPCFAGGGEGLFLGNGGPVTTVVDSSGPFESFLGPSINDLAQTAFRAELDSGGEGLFGGPDPVADRILLFGDALDGGIVDDIEFFRALNDGGSVAFLARFTDGREGIYRADPLQVPEPPVLALLVAGWLAGSFWRSRNRERRDSIGWR